MRCSSRCASSSFASRRAARPGAPRARRGCRRPRASSIVRRRHVVARGVDRDRSGSRRSNRAAQRVDLADRLDRRRRRTRRGRARPPRRRDRSRPRRRARGTCRDGSRSRCAGTACRRACAAAVALDPLSPRSRNDQHVEVRLPASRGRRCTRRSPRSSTSLRSSSALRGRVAHLVDLVVDRRVLLDVRVGRRDVRLGLVVVVVADEVADGVLGEEACGTRGRAARRASCSAR